MRLIGLIIRPIVPQITHIKEKYVAAKKRVFISFDIDNDEETKNVLVLQQRNSRSPFEFKDNSVKKHLTGNWEEKVKQRMDNVDVVLVLCGTKTHTAKGVAIELKIAKEKNKSYFLLAAYKDKKCTKPTSAGSSDKLHKWTWQNLKVLIDGAR